MEGEYHMLELVLPAKLWIPKGTEAIAYVHLGRTEYKEPKEVIILEALVLGLRYVWQQTVCLRCHTIIPQGNNYSTQAEPFSNRTTVLCTTCKQKVDDHNALMIVLIIIIFLIGLLVICIPLF